MIGLIGTMTIMAGLVIPPAVVKMTADNELAYTYEFEKMQSSLLALLSAEDRGKTVYETIGTDYVLGNPTRGDVKTQFEQLVVKDYFVAIISEHAAPTSTAPPGGILTDQPTEARIIFNTVFVLPYNEESLVKILGIGIP